MGGFGAVGVGDTTEYKIKGRSAKNGGDGVRGTQRPWGWGQSPGRPFDIEETSLKWGSGPGSS